MNEKLPNLDPYACTLPVMELFVRIMLAGAGCFAEVEIKEGDTISRLVRRACSEFPSWKADPAQLSLHLVAEGGNDLPSSSAVGSARHLDQIGWSLKQAGVSPGAWLVARKIVTCGAPISGGGEGGGGGHGNEELAREVAALTLEVKATRTSSEWLIPPSTRDMATNVVFAILAEGVPIGCGFFVTQTLAFTVSHNIHASGLKTGFAGRTLAGSVFRFNIVVDLIDDDFMILQAPTRTSTDFFKVIGGSSCAALLGSKSVALLGCGIAMADMTHTGEGASTLGVGLTITTASVCQVGASNKHFGYTASTYDGDSGACLFFSPDNCVVGIHQEGVNRAKELVEQEESMRGILEDGSPPTLRGALSQLGTKRIRDDLAQVTDSVKSIIRGMTTGGIGLFLGSTAVQEAFQRAQGLHPQ